MSNSLDPVDAWQNVVPDLVPNYLQRLSADDTGSENVRAGWVSNLLFLIIILLEFNICEIQHM